MSNNPQVINKNYLSQLEFKFILNRAPHVNFFIQRVNIPQISLPTAEMPTPFTKIPYPGDHIDYAPLSVEFKIDEDFKSYIEIHNWIKALGYPNEYEEHAAIKNIPQFSGNGVFSDITLIVTNSVKRGNMEIVFKDCLPTSLSDLVFETTDSDVEYISALATFDYTNYSITRI